MRTQVSKTMCKALNDALKDRIKNDIFTNIFHFDYDELTENQYHMFVDYDLFMHGNDFNPENNTFKVIRITYNEDCFSTDRFITTNDLIRCVKTYGNIYHDFINGIFYMFEI